MWRLFKVSKVSCVDQDRELSAAESARSMLTQREQTLELEEETECKTLNSENLYPPNPKPKVA